MKIVINNCFGGFSLSPAGEQELAQLQGKKVYFYKQTKYRFQGGRDEYQRVDPTKGESFYFTLTRNLGEVINDLPDEEGLWFDSREIHRDDSNLLTVIKRLGNDANGECAKLKVVEIPDDVEWEIDEYDGNEWIAEKHRRWE